MERYGAREHRVPWEKTLLSYSREKAWNVSATPQPRNPATMRKPHVEEQVRTGVHVKVCGYGRKMTFINYALAEKRALVAASHIDRELKQIEVSP